MNRKNKQDFIKYLFLLFALVSIIVLGLIVFSLFREGMPLFATVPFRDFLFGLEWYPTYDPPSFGIFPLIVGSLIVTAIATLISVPLGVLAAVTFRE
jgi:phosphate transport system permease protein